MKTKFNSRIAILLILSGTFLGACQDYFNPDPVSVALEKDLFDEWAEFRSASMGMYGLMQEIVEQKVVLGELRGDLLEPTKNANRDLIQVNNFNVLPSNKYASPVAFYKLIANCNNLIYQIKKKKPSVVDFTVTDNIDNYDWLYGEVVCMRAWAYFNAVRIFEKVPYIYPDLRSVDDIRAYVNDTAYIHPADSVDKDYFSDADHYNHDGYHYDSVIVDSIKLNKFYLDMSSVIDTFTYELEKRVKRVGVKYGIDDGDLTWDITTWNNYAYHTLLGQLYLYDGNMTMAEVHFNRIVYDQSESDGVRYGLDDTFSENSWDNIFTTLNKMEHIFVLDFDKAYQQQNGFQELFDNTGGNKYMLKPTSISVEKFETSWNGFQIVNPNSLNAQLAYDSSTGLYAAGTPGDKYRGHGVSYVYDGLDVAGGLKTVLELKKIGETKEAYQIMEQTDTLVNKYSMGQNAYDRDVDFIVYRAGEVHLYYAEVLNRSVQPSNVAVHQTTKALQVLNSGDYGNNNADCNGVRGRVGFQSLYAGSYVHKHDPYTNKVISSRYFPPKDGRYPNNYSGKIDLIEDYIIDEKTRECAYEGERFFDLIRISRRRNNPSYLADRISAKFGAGDSQVMKLRLLDESNWYIDFQEFPQ